MKIAVSGSRKFTDIQKIEDTLASLSPVQIISGGAAGPDSIAKQFARQNGIDFVEILPLFKRDRAVKYHPRWYLERNKEIVDAADVLVAFWDGLSKGTKQTIDYATKTGKRCIVINQDH